MRKATTPGSDPDARLDVVTVACAKHAHDDDQSASGDRKTRADECRTVPATRSTSMTPGWSSTRGTAITRPLPCWSGVMNES